MFTLHYRCKFREFWYEEEFADLQSAIEAGRRRVLRSGTPARVLHLDAEVWRMDP